MNNINLLKKYAFTYLSKYDSTKKNLERILKKKIIRIKDINTNEKKYLNNSINQIIKNLEENKIIDDESFASKKILSFFHQGKSEFFIRIALLKKGVSIKLINILLDDFTNKNPDWKINSAIKFAKKHKLGEYGSLENKKKDTAKMIRAGFKYNIILKVLGY